MIDCVLGGIAPAPWFAADILACNSCSALVLAGLARLACKGVSTSDTAPLLDALASDSSCVMHRVSKPLLAQAFYLGPYHQLTILDESVGQLLSNVKWDGLRILSAQYPLRVGRSVTRMRSTVLTHTFNKCIRQAMPHMVRASSIEGGQNQPILHYTSDIVLNLVPENDWYVDFPDGIRLVKDTKFRAFSTSFRTRDWGEDKLVLMVDIFQEKRFYEQRHQSRMEWDNQCKFLCLLQLQHRRIVIRMWLVGKNEAGIVSASWNKGVLAMADHAGFGEIIPWKQAIEALLREAWYVRH